MKVGEARQKYNVLLKQYNEKQTKLLKEKSTLEKKLKINPNDDSLKDKLDSVEINYSAVKDKYEEYQKYMESLMEQWNAKFNEVSSKQGAEAMDKATQEEAKVMTTVRRMCKGDHVPAGDEARVMKYDYKIYMMAKNMQAMARMTKKKIYKHKSLWDDDNEGNKENQVDPAVEADNQECAVGSEPDADCESIDGEVDG